MTGWETALGDTILARRAAWLMERYAEDSTTESDLDAEVVDLDSRPASEWIRGFDIFRRPLDEVLEFVERSPTQGEVRVRSGPDSLRLSVLLGDDGRVRASALMYEPAAGVTIRSAVEDDGPGLADLERRCPVEGGGISTVYDRGVDWFAQQRLMGEHITSVAELDGRIVGVMSDAPRVVRFDGNDVTLIYRFHLRVDPACRGMHIYPALNAHQGGRVVRRFGPRPVGISYIAASNDTMLGVTGGRQREMVWTTPIERYVIDCAANAGSRDGRTGSQDDVEAIASALHATHGREVLAPTFDYKWVEQRLTRSPQDYSWSDFAVTDRAVVGVWNQDLTVVRTSATDATASRRATVADWGWSAGGEADLIALIRSWCRRLAEAGTDELVLYISEWTPGRDLLGALTARLETYMSVVDLPEPHDAVQRGVYVDAIWF